MIRDFDNAPGLSRKLIPKIEGPYVIKSILQNDRYCVSDIEGFQNTAKPYEGTWEAVNMRLQCRTDNPNICGIQFNGIRRLEYKILGGRHLGCTILGDMTFGVYNFR